MTATRKKILLFGYLPPPVFGPSVAYSSLMRSGFAAHFDVTFINLSVVDNIRELEKFKIKKLAKLAKFFLLELWSGLVRRPALCCYPISYNRNASLKDCLLLGLARLLGMRTILWAHGAGLPQFRNQLTPSWRHRFDRYITQSAGVLVLAECLRSEFDGLVAAERIHVVTIGIEPQTLPPATAQIDGGQTILYLGALLRAKGIFDLLAAMPAILADRPKTRLVVAGEWFKPAEQAEAGQFIREHNLVDAVQFIGPVQGDKKWQQFANADLFVFPPHSQTEAFGIVLLEAMQAGLPIVTTRGGARSEILADGINGRLAAEKNPADLAEKISHLLADPVLRQTIGNANRQRFAECYTAERYGQRLIEIFEAIDA